MVIQEALIAKKAIIAADIGGIPELIEHGKNGLLFQPNNIDELYAKVRQIIENPSLLEKFAQHQTNIKSIEENAGKLEQIYENLTQGAKVGVRSGGKILYV